MNYKTVIIMKSNLYKERGHICIQTVTNIHGTAPKSQTADDKLLKNLDSV